MSVRSRMRMRVTTVRDVRVTDNYGDAGAPLWQTVLSSQPCFAWNRISSVSGIRISDEGVVSDYYPVMMVPIGTNIEQDDRILCIKDKLDNELFTDMDITSILRRPQHLEVRMKHHA